MKKLIIKAVKYENLLIEILRTKNKYYTDESNIDNVYKNDTNDNDDDRIKPSTMDSGLNNEHVKILNENNDDKDEK